MLLGSAAYDEERSMRYLDLMVDRRVDGIIVASSQISEQHLARLLRAPIPVVVVNAEPAGISVPVIVSDNEGGSSLAVQHLLELGHRHIGYIRGPGAYTAATPRLEGFLGACADAGLAPDWTPVVRGEGQVDSGERGAAALLEQAPELTAIACYNDLTAIAVSSGACSSNAATPRSPLSTWPSPRTTGVQSGASPASAHAPRKPSRRGVAAVYAPGPRMYPMCRCPSCSRCCTARLLPPSLSLTITGTGSPTGSALTTTTGIGALRSLAQCCSEIWLDATMMPSTRRSTIRSR